MVDLGVEPPGRVLDHGAERPSGEAPPDQDVPEVPDRAQRHVVGAPEHEARVAPVILDPAVTANVLERIRSKPEDRGRGLRRAPRRAPTEPQSLRRSRPQGCD